MSEVKGVHLWEVTIQVSSLSRQTLWITTAKHDIAAAIKKATTFIRDKQWEFHDPANKIIAVESNGTIDA